MPALEAGPLVGSQVQKSLWAQFSSLQEDMKTRRLGTSCPLHLIILGRLWPDMPVWRFYEKLQRLNRYARRGCCNCHDTHPYAGIYVISNLGGIADTLATPSRISFSSDYLFLVKNKMLLIVLLIIATLSAFAIYFLTKKGPEKTDSESGL